MEKQYCIGIFGFAGFFVCLVALGCLGFFLSFFFLGGGGGACFGCSFSCLFLMERGGKWMEVVNSFAHGFQLCYRNRISDIYGDTAFLFEVHNAWGISGKNEYKWTLEV